MVLSVISSLTGLSDNVVVALFTVSLTMVLGYIFYPAISLSMADSIAIDQETLTKGGRAPLLSLLALSSCLSLLSCRLFSFLDSYNVLLSIVIPAYNEEERLPIMLDAATQYVNQNRSSVVKACQAAVNNNANSTAIEWIVVSDGSTDGTAQVAREYAAKESKQQKDTWKLVSLQTNGGKGAAVKAGMMRARGEILLMVDADGATDFGVGFENVIQKLSPSTKVVFGSRAHLQSASTAQRSLVRTLLMHAFHFFVQVLCSSQVQDTQCGFKLFTRETAMQLFGNLHLRRWAFDTELLVLAEKSGIDIAEVAVPWHEVDGSKLDTSKFALAMISLGMLRDMICVRACYTLRLWRVTHK